MVDDSLMIWCFQQKYADTEIFGDMTLIVAIVGSVELARWI